MGEATVIILHPPPGEDGSLTSVLHEARGVLAEHQAALFAEAGAERVHIERAPKADSFGLRLDELAASATGGLVVLGAGSLARLRPVDARRLVEVARGAGPPALSNNRYSSDVLAVADAVWLRGLGEERGDNALPRRLAERGVTVAEMPARDRLAMDLDTPLDLALLALMPGIPRTLRELAAIEDLRVPRLAEIRAVAADRQAELLIFGRTSSRGLTWLERHTACRIRFLSEERGLRTAPVDQRPSRASLGRLIDARGPEALASIVAELADGAILDSRVLLADRFGRDESGWPRAEDRYASDLLRSADIADPWLRALTAAVADARAPILLGGHTLVGPALPATLGRAHDARMTRGCR